MRKHLLVLCILFVFSCQSHRNVDAECAKNYDNLLGKNIDEFVVALEEMLSEEGWSFIHIEHGVWSYGYIYNLINYDTHLVETAKSLREKKFIYPDEYFPKNEGDDYVQELSKAFPKWQTEGKALYFSKMECISSQICLYDGTCDLIFWFNKNDDTLVYWTSHKVKQSIIGIGYVHTKKSGCISKSP